MKILLMDFSALTLLVQFDQRMLTCLMQIVASGNFDLFISDFLVILPKFWFLSSLPTLSNICVIGCVFVCDGVCVFVNPKLLRKVNYNISHLLDLHE